MYRREATQPATEAAPTPTSTTAGGAGNARQRMPGVSLRDGDEMKTPQCAQSDTRGRLPHGGPVKIHTEITVLTGSTLFLSRVICRIQVINRPRTLTMKL